MDTDNSELGWREWSKYVLLTLEKLAKDLQNCNTDRLHVKANMLNNLSELKILLIEKINNSENSTRKNVKEVVDKIEDLIKSVSDETDTLSDKVSDFNEKIILPLRIRLAVISILGGFFGGIMATGILPLIWRLLGGI